MPVLSEWLQIMLGEIGARRDEAARVRAEEQTRLQERHAGVAAEATGATETAPGAPADAAPAAADLAPGDAPAEAAPAAADLAPGVPALAGTSARRPRG